MWNRRTAGEIDPAEVDVHHELEIIDGLVVGVLRRIGDAHHARIGDDDVEPAQFVGRIIDERLHLLLLRNVGDLRPTRDTESANLVTDRLHAIRLVTDRNVGSRLRECDRVRLAKTCRCSGDESATPLQ